MLLASISLYFSLASSVFDHVSDVSNTKPDPSLLSHVKNTQATASLSVSATW